MSRISGKFSELRQAGRKALIPYIAAGDPEPSMTVSFMHDLVNAGADIIELGVPFSDPMADGPTIQRASERALQHKVSLTGVLEMVASFREQDQDTPVVLMGYLNPMEVMGITRFCEMAQNAGIDGVLTVDMPPEEAQDWVTALKRVNVDPIFLIAPTTDATRIEHINRFASGYLYYVSLKGVTGAANLDTDNVASKLTEIRAHTELPIGVGFGIKDGTTAAAVAKVADAVVVGSALINRIELHLAQPDKISQELKEFIGSLRLAMDQAV